MRMILSASALAAVLVFLVGAPPVAETERGENLEAAIEHLLEFVRASDVVFIRNNTEHTPAEAADHIARKYDHYRKKIETPEDFIRLSASKSMMSGRPYTVRLPGGAVITTREWLEAELAKFRAARAALPDSAADSAWCGPGPAAGRDGVPR